MKYDLKKSFLSAMTGAAAACGIFGMVFAMTTPIKEEGAIPDSKVYQLVASLAPENISCLREQMDPKALLYIEDAMVEDNDVSIIMAYLQLYPAFEYVNVRKGIGPVTEDGAGQ